MKQNQAQWILTDRGIFTLRENEMTVILQATILIDGKMIDTGNLFVETFKKQGEKKNGNW
jgi:3-keto-L-gulonate-6-phosphate decarboxylase